MLKVCLGTYKAYNEGTKLGEWIDISDFNDEQELLDWLKTEFNESDPEPMIQDSNFSDGLLESTNLADLFSLNEFMEEHPEFEDDAIADALELYGITDVASTLEDNYIGDRETVASFIYNAYLQPRVDRIQNEEDKEFFQNLIDRYDVNSEVDVWEANGTIISGSHGNYFWHKV